MQKITDLFGIQYPVIQGGMVWNSGWRLASAVSGAGGLGLIGAGSMYPDVLKEHIEKCKIACNKPFGVNVPMLYPDLEEIMDVIIKSGVKIVFTSAGNPKIWTSKLQSHGIKVAHVVSNLKFALKAQEAGVDAIVAEGFEAGGHNGREETTTFTLIPLLKQHINVPLIAAGGIAGGKSMLAAIALGADAVQIGSRFVLSEEASSHNNFKQLIAQLGDGSTQLTLKELAPVRLVKNKFFHELEELYKKGAAADELKAHLGKGRAKLGMFEGDLDNGELEIGQVSAYISQIKPAAEIVREIVEDYNIRLKELQSV